MTAQEWYEQGNAFRKESKWHEAINCYIQAIALDPDSPRPSTAISRLLRLTLTVLLSRLSGCLMTSWPSIARICIIPEPIKVQGLFL